MITFQSKHYPREYFIFASLPKDLMIPVRQQVGDVKKSDLPGPETLQQPGNKEGHVVMIRGDGGAVEAHQVCRVCLSDAFQCSSLVKWSSGAWQKIGEVVDAVGSGRRQLYNGKEYDYVFDVDIQDGAPPLKLPYDISGKDCQLQLQCKFDGNETYAISMQKILMRLHRGFCNAMNCLRHILTK